MAYTSIAVWLDADTRVGVDDRPHPTVRQRVVTIAWDSLTIHLDSRTDELTAAAASLLVEAAQQIRSAALARIAERGVSSEDAQDAPLGPDGLPDVPLARTAA